MIEVYTDGSNVHNGKEYSYGGYGFVIKIEDHVLEGGGTMFLNESKPVTNNRAELLAILESLNLILELGFTDTSIQLYSDSQWCVKTINGEWSMKKNMDLWLRFNKIKKKLKVSKIDLKVEWIKGHVGNHYNEIADDIAGMYCKQARPDHF